MRLEDNVTAGDETIRKVEVDNDINIIDAKTIQSYAC